MIDLPNIPAAKRIERIGKQTLILGDCRDILPHLPKVDAQEDIGDRQAVTLSTIHGFKGLEAACVFVVEMNQGGFPSSRSLKEVGGEAEERRVGYVGFTRAIESLLVHYRKPEDQSDRGPIKAPSQFIFEAGLHVEREAAVAR